MAFNLPPDRELLRWLCLKRQMKSGMENSSLGPLILGLLIQAILNLQKCSLLSIQMKSIFPVSAYNGALI